MHFCPGIPIILVGSKVELRHDPRTIEELRKYHQHPVTYEEASVKLCLTEHYNPMRLLSGVGSFEEDTSKALRRMLRKNWRGCT